MGLHDLSKRGLYYLASPYNAHSAEIKSRRVEQACLKAAELISQGYRIFSPIAHNVTIIEASNGVTGWEVWGDLDRTILLRCDALVVLCLEGWEGSHGVNEEIKIAHANHIDVVYIDP